MVVDATAREGMSMNLKSSKLAQNGPLSSYLAHRDEIDKAIKGVLSGGRYILGQEVAAFEKEFAQYIGVRYGIGVGNGTDAIHLALRSCSIGPGDEVITVPNTAVATVAAIELAGAKPVLVDIDPKTFTMDPDRIEAALTSRTKAIIPVHLYGHPADIQSINSLAADHDLYVIEDCAQSHGALYRGRMTGSWGDIAAFSFYPTKNLGAIGDGGMVVTNDQDLADRAKLLREYGWRQRAISEIPGLNTRLDEMQASILRVKLPYLNEENNHRRKLAEINNHLLSSTGLVLPAEKGDVRHVYHQYVVRSNQRDALKAYLEKNCIPTQIHYPLPIHLQPAYIGRLGEAGSFPESEKACKEILSLPLHQYLNEDYPRWVDGLILEWLS